MALRTVAAVFIIVVSIVFLQIFLAEPVTEVTDALNESGDYSIGGQDMNDTFGTLVASFWNMGWIAIFGVMGWGVYRVLRRELTRGRRP